MCRYIFLYFDTNQWTGLFTCLGEPRTLLSAWFTSELYLVCQHQQMLIPLRFTLYAVNIVLIDINAFILRCTDFNWAPIAICSMYRVIFYCVTELYRFTEMPLEYGRNRVEGMRRSTYVSNPQTS